MSMIRIKVRQKPRTRPRPVPDFQGIIIDYDRDDRIRCEQSDVERWQAERRLNRLMAFRSRRTVGVRNA